ncbi:MAG: hypothetical protein CL575_05920 [Altererythrobacter sp.]|nr:hypothetical protein [Altererythrobacter sp.]
MKAIAQRANTDCSDLTGKRIKFVGLALAAFVALGNSANAQSDNANDYDLAAALDPASGALSVTGTIDIVADKRTEEIEMLLNGQLRIERISFSREAEMQTENGITCGTYPLPHTQRMRIALAQPMEPGDHLQIALAYSGNLTTESFEMGRGIVSPLWTELSADSLWYPVWYDEPDIRYTLSLDLPPQFDVVGPGTYDRVSDGKWRLSSPGIVNTRITFAASDSWTIAEREIGDGLTGAVYTARGTAKTDSILTGLEQVFEAYRGFLGAPSLSTGAIKIIYPGPEIEPTYPQQAYVAGNDFIVLDESHLQVQLDTLNHEVAHLWWSRGASGTPDEFLSESIAEYLAKRHGGDLWGAEWLERQRDRMRARSEKIDTSLLEIDGFTSDRQALLYNRGPTMLFALQDRIGRGAIDAILHELHSRQADTLDDFFGILSARHGDAMVDWAREHL